MLCGNRFILRCLCLAIAICFVLAGCKSSGDVNDPALNADPTGNQRGSTNPYACLLFDRYGEESPVKGEVQLLEQPEVVFRWSFEDVYHSVVMIARDGVEMEAFSAVAGLVKSAYLSDVTGDGEPDICANLYFGFSGIPSYEAVYVYDSVKDTYYMLADGENLNHYTKISYSVSLEDGNLICKKIHDATRQVVASGTLFLGDGANGKVLCMQEQATYPLPVYYEFDGENKWQDRVKLTVCGDGTCDISFNPRLNDDNTSDWAQGTYRTENGKLIMTTEEGKVYTFRFVGEDLAFVAAESDPLHEDCALYDGGILIANPVVLG